MKLIIVKTIYGDYIMNDELTIYKKYATRFYSVTSARKMAKVLGLKKNEYVIIKEDQNGNLKITSTNHDGRSYYTIKKE